MNKAVGLLLALLFCGCYTQLQLANKETPSVPVYYPPVPIIIIVTDPPPPPRPHPGPSHPIIIKPAEQLSAPAVSNDNKRVRTDGATRDNNERREREGRR